MEEKGGEEAFLVMSEEAFCLKSAAARGTYSYSMVFCSTHGDNNMSILVRVCISVRFIVLLFLSVVR